MFLILLNLSLILLIYIKILTETEEIHFKQKKNLLGQTLLRTIVGKFATSKLEKSCTTCLFEHRQTHQVLSHVFTYAKSSLSEC